MFTGELHPVPGNSLQQHRQKIVEATLVPQEGLAQTQHICFTCMSFPCLESSAVVSSRSCSRSLKSCQENGVQVSIEPAAHRRVHHIQRWSATSMSSQSSSSTVRSTTSSSLRTAISTSWSCSAIGCHALTLSVRNSRNAHLIPRATIRVSGTREPIPLRARAVRAAMSWSWISKCC